MTTCKTQFLWGDYCHNASKKGCDYCSDCLCGKDGCTNPVYVDYPEYSYSGNIRDPYCPDHFTKDDRKRYENLWRSYTVYEEVTLPVYPKTFEPVF